MQFTVDALNKWLTLVSNLGVAAGFVLLATQVRQSADEIRLQQLSGRFDGTRTAAVAMFGETAHSALATALLRPSELNADQITQLWALLEMYVIDADEMFTAYRTGYATERDWEIARRSAVVNIHHPVGRILWRHLRDSYDPDLVQEIDRALAQAEDLDWPGAYRSVVEDLKALPNPASGTPSTQP